ncbi:putative glycosyltransferase EpsD [Abditibacteriota bacterium]|nr:putative glycosyltransferase EpsD [Abditibacteriota bacterium]
MKVLACNAPYNDGGMGKFLAELVEQSRAEGTLECYFSSVKKPNDEAGREISLHNWRWLFRSPFLRHRHSWRDYLAADLFDRVVAHQLSRSQIFVGFSGRTYRSFRQARKLGYEQLVLESATSHVAHIRERHEVATRTHPIESSWLGEAQYKKTLREYDEADVIVVTSEYSRQSFLNQGIPASKLKRRWQSVAPRFAPAPQREQSNGFHIVYTGRLQVTKGLPILMEAFAAIKDHEARLTLIGGCATEEMEEYFRQKIASDPRIQIRPGDPLPYLHQADVLVHPTFEDGLGLGPLEALACGVPVIVTEDTGMKEFVREGVNGYILPTGDVAALVKQLEAIRINPLKGQFVPLSATDTAPKGS